MFDVAHLAPRAALKLGEIPAVKYWLDAGSITGLADGATISASHWRDESASRRGPLATATACIWRKDGGNGQPAVEFNGSNSSVASPSFALAQPLRIFMVAKSLSVSGSGSFTRRYLDSGTGGAAIGQGVVAPTPDRGIRLHAGLGWSCIDKAAYLPWNNKALSELSTDILQQWRLIDATFNGASSTLAMEFNPPKNGNPGSGAISAGITLGASAAGLADYFINAQIAEFVVCDATILPSDAAQAIKLHLMRKHRISGNGAFICAGSSFTSGVGVTPGTTDWASQFGMLMSKPNLQWCVQNFGVSAQTTPAAITYAAVNYDTPWPGVFAQTFLFLDGGSFGNDILSNDPGAATAYNSYVTYFTGRQAAGYDRARCVAFTAGPRSDLVGSKDTDRQTVNTNIRNNWRSFAGALVDIDADPRLTTPAGDGVNYSAAQYGVWAELVKRAVNPLIAA